MLGPLLGVSPSARGSPRRRARARCRRRRCSRWRASWASSASPASRARRARWRRSPAAGPRSTAARCSRRARSTSSATCSAQLAHERRRGGLGRLAGEGLHRERRRPFGADDDRRRGADRRARDPGVLRGRLRIRPSISLNSAGRMLTLAYFGIESSGLNLVVDLLILFVVVLYLSLIYWTYADARRRIHGSDARRLRHGGVAVPVRGHDRLHDPAPAGVPGGRARARAGDAGRRGAPARVRPLAVPALRLPRRARLRALSELPAQAQGALRQLLAPARPGVDDLPVLRDRGRAERAGTPHAPPAHAGRDRRRAGRAGDDDQTRDGAREGRARAQGTRGGDGRRRRGGRGGGRRSGHARHARRGPRAGDTIAQQPAGPAVRAPAAEPGPAPRSTSIQQRNPWTER